MPYVMARHNSLAGDFVYPLNEISNLSLIATTIIKILLLNALCDTCTIYTSM